MPTYEYVCDSCSHEFELFQKMSDPPAKNCPECKGKLRKKIGAGAGLIFKGSGFYITDYRSEGYKKAAEAESGAATSKESSGGSSSSGEKTPSGGGTGEKKAPTGDPKSGKKEGSTGPSSSSSSGTKSAS